MIETIIINSRKFDGQIHRTWKCKFVEHKDSLLIFVGKFEKKIFHSKLGLIRRGTVSYEYYWLDRWFNIFRFHEPNGDLRNFYCNITKPPKFQDGVLDYIDLDIDILVWKNFDVEVLDLDDYRANTKKFDYSAELQEKVQETLDKLLEMINLSQFPFDFKQSNNFERKKYVMPKTPKENPT